MAALSVLLAGGAFGVRHALEADHLAAVATLVEGERRRSPALVGASWGVGHSVPIVALGLALLSLGVEVPPAVTHALEGLVGLVLVGLGVRTVLAARGVVGIHSHSHGGGGRAHGHLRLGRFSLGSTHVHLAGDSAVVGVLHGLAGSGAIVVAMVAASPSTAGALGFLAAFSLASIATMAAVALAWGRALSTGLATRLRIAAGLAGVAVGLALLAGALGAL